MITAFIILWLITDVVRFYSYSEEVTWPNDIAKGILAIMAVLYINDQLWLIR